MIRCRWLLLAACCITLVSPPALAEEADERTLRGAYIDFAPMSYTDEQGQASGKFIELTHELMDKAGYSVEWQELPIGRIYRYLRSGEIDLWAGASGVPYAESFTVEPDFQPMSTRLYAFYLSDTPAIDSVGDLLGSNLILVRGFTYFGLLDEAIQDHNTPYDLAPSHTSGMRMLRKGRGEYLLDFESSAKAALEEVNVPGLQRSQITEWDIAHVFSQQTDNVDRIVADLEDAWTKLKEKATPRE